MQCTSTSLHVLHFDVQFHNSQGDPTENKHLKGMVALLVDEMCYVVELHIKVK